MNSVAAILLGALLGGSLIQAGSGRLAPQRFIFFDRERQRIADADFLTTRAIAGAQLKYLWRELEPERDRYALGPVLDDLAFLERHGKRLFIQLQDVSFDGTIVNVPDYLRKDPEFSGGVARQYEVEGDDDRNSATGQPVTAAELHLFARDVLRLDYVFWGTQEPHLTTQVLPLLRALSEDAIR